MSDPIRDRIERTLLAHRLQHQVIEDSMGDGLPLVDALSTGDDISTGKEELFLLADAIAGDLSEVLPAPLPEPDYEMGGAPVSPLSDAPAGEPRGGAAGEVIRAAIQWREPPDELPGLAADAALIRAVDALLAAHPEIGKEVGGGG